MDKKIGRILLIEIIVAVAVNGLLFLWQQSQPRCQGIGCFADYSLALPFFVFVGSLVAIVTTLAVGSTRSLTQKRGNPFVGIGVLIAILLFGFFLIWKVQQ